MDYLNKCFRVFLYQLRRGFLNHRIWLLFIMIGIFIYSTVNPVTSFSKMVDIPASPWVFPHLTNDYIYQMVFMAGVILLFCDAPFKSGANQYILARSGRKAWSGGHALYILTVSMLYVLFLVFVSTISLLPEIQWNEGWGKIWGTLARTTAANQIKLQFTVNDYLIGAYSPIKATIYSILLEWACCIWLGFLIYVLNTLTKRMLGTFAAAGFVLLDLMIANGWTNKFYSISPITLAQLSSLSGVNKKLGIDLRYSVHFYIISILILLALCLVSGYFDKWGDKLKLKDRLSVSVLSVNRRR